MAYVVAAHAVLVTDAGGDASSFEEDAPAEKAEATEATTRDDADRALVRAAWASARAAYDATWTRGLAFRAPEATDDEGRFRGASDVKNGAVWVLDRALTRRATEAATSDSVFPEATLNVTPRETERGRGVDDAIPVSRSDVKDAEDVRDEL